MSVSKTILKYGAGVVAAWLLASLLGAFGALGPGHLARADVSFASIACTVGTVAVLAGLGWLWLKNFRRWWARTLAFVVALPLVLVVASPLVNAAWAAFPASPSLDAPRPAGATDVAVPCGDVTLAAWYLPSDNGAAVVLSHGSGSTRANVIAHARVLNEAGYGVLMFDARGHGDSTGAPMAFGWWGEADISCAVDALIALPGVEVESIGLVGMSMGAEESIGAAGLDPRVRAVVAEGATSRTAEDKEGWLPDHLLGQLQRVLDDERDLILKALTDAPKPQTLRDAASRSDAPMLLITAGTVPDEAAAAAWIAEGNNRIDVWTVPRAAHTHGLSSRPDEWERRVTAFLDGALSKDAALSKDEALAP